MGTAQRTRRSDAATPDITLSEADGVRYLHFGTEWIQGAMRLARPYALELEYQQLMMAVGLCLPQPQRIVLLGLGAAALAKFCWRSCAPAHVVAVELAPGVVEVARQWFSLPPDDERLCVMIDDAREFITRAAAQSSADWLLVDLYDSQARGPVYDDVDFYAACCAVLREPGVAAFNLFGRRFAPSYAAIKQAFCGRAITLPATPEGNRIVLGYRGENFDQLPAAMSLHAPALQARWRLPVQQWIKGSLFEGSASRETPMRESGCEFTAKLA